MKLHKNCPSAYVCGGEGSEGTVPQVLIHNINAMDRSLSIQRTRRRKRPRFVSTWQQTEWFCCCHYVHVVMSGTSSLILAHGTKAGHSWSEESGRSSTRVTTTRAHSVPELRLLMFWRNFRSLRFPAVKSCTATRAHQSLIPSPRVPFLGQPCHY